MGPYNNKGKPGANKLFGQTMRKSSRSSAATRYQRQFGKSSNAGNSKSDTTQADEVAARRRLRQEQGEAIDTKFGYHRLEDQYQENKKNMSLRTETIGANKSMQRRGWLFNMAATTVSFVSENIIRNTIHQFDMQL